MRSVSIDQALIDRAINGDKEAYATLVRATGSRSLVVAERILRSPEDAVAAARKLFVLAYTNLRKLKDLSAPELWLMQNLVRLCGESIRDAAKKGTVLSVECQFPKDLTEAGLLDTLGAVDTTGGVPEALGAAATADAMASRAGSASVVAKRRATVKRAVDCLPFLERTALIFRDWDGMSYLEVAEILRVKQEDMRKLLVRGRKGVAEMLTPEASQARKAPDAAARAAATDRKTARELTRRRAQCGKVHDRIWLLVGGEVGPTELTEVMTHLRQCPECSDLLKKASTLLEAIRDAAPLEDKPLIAPEMLWKEVEPLLAG